MTKSNDVTANGAKPSDSGTSKTTKTAMTNSNANKNSAPSAPPADKNAKTKPIIIPTAVTDTVIANPNATENGITKPNDDKKQTDTKTTDKPETNNKTSKDNKSKRISIKQIANKAKEKKNSPEHSEQEQDTAHLTEKHEPMSRKESLQVLVVPPNGDVPKPFRTNSRLSVSSTRRLSVESHRSLDFNPLPNNGTTVNSNNTPLPAEVDDKYLLLQSADDSYIRSAIPVLPIPAAVMCLLINIVLPGFGTVLSGLSCMCCGTPRIRAKGDTRTVTCWVNVFVGVCQFCTITLCFVGWAWSLAWGILLVHFSVHFHRQKKQRRQVELQALALRAFTTNESGRKLPF